MNIFGDVGKALSALKEIFNAKGEIISKKRRISVFLKPFSMNLFIA